MERSAHTRSFCLAPWQWYYIYLAAILLEGRGESLTVLRPSHLPSSTKTEGERTVMISHASFRFCCRSCRGSSSGVHAETAISPLPRPRPRVLPRRRITEKLCGPRRFLAPTRRMEKCVERADMREAQQVRVRVSHRIP